MNIFVFVICTTLFSSTVFAAVSTLYTDVAATVSSQTDETTAVSSPPIDNGTTVSSQKDETATTVSSPPIDNGTTEILQTNETATTVSSPPIDNGTTVSSQKNETATTVSSPPIDNGTTEILQTNETATNVNSPTIDNGTTESLQTNETATAVSFPPIDNGTTESLQTNETATTVSLSSPDFIKTTSSLITTTTEMHPDIAPKWDNIKLEIPLAIVINDTFVSELNDRTSSQFIDLAGKFKKELHNVYEQTPHFSDIEIKSFSNGSIKCLYSIVLDTRNLTKKSLGEVIKYIKDKCKKEVSNIKGIGRVNVNETLKLMDADLKKANDSFMNLCKTYGAKMCRYDHKCEIKKGLYQEPHCVYKCNIDVKLCGDYGTCSVDTNGKTTCKCKEDPLYVFHGERCDIKEEKLLLTKNYIIAITAGGGGAVILILFIAMICLCSKWSKAKKATQFYRNRSNKSLKDRESVAYEDDGMQMENSRIENVYMGKYGHDNNSYMVDSAPSTDDSSMRYEKGRYYRVVKDPELGAETLIYQPSNLNIPIQRESTISRDDEPDPLRTHYNYIDTDSVYKIKRPNVRTNTFDRNGHPRTVL